MKDRRVSEGGDFETGSDRIIEWTISKDHQGLSTSLSAAGSTLDELVRNEAPPEAKSDWLIRMEPVPRLI